MNIPRIVVASPHSGAGKTTISIGLMGALVKKGLKVQPFKVGPDFIDPSYHHVVTNVPSRNLDTWLTPSDAMLEIFERAVRGADIALIEGVMGLYDGLRGSTASCSTAEISTMLKSPVILVVDAAGMARSAAALVLGYQLFDKNVNLKGVIINRIGSATHLKWIKEAIEERTGIPVIGGLPKKGEFRMSERHLGLVPTSEKQIGNRLLSRLIDFVEENVDTGRVIDIACSAGDLPESKGRIYPVKPEKVRVRIGVAFDEAFNFYYRDNLDLLEAYGAKVVYYSPIHDANIPEGIDGLYFGGGFPEMFARRLAENESMRRSVRRAVEDEMPIYSECGGLMFLTNSIVDFNGNQHPMVGALRARTVMKKRRKALNYTVAKVVNENLLSHIGEEIHGHEFHYSIIEDVPGDTKFAYRLERGEGIRNKCDGWIEHSTLASYMHIHFAYDIRLARNFINTCEQYRHT